MAFRGGSGGRSGRVVARLIPPSRAPGPGQVRPLSVPSSEKLRQIERRLRIELDWVRPSAALDSLETLVATDDALFLDLVDLLLSEFSATALAGVSHIQGLERALVEGGSAWRVASRGDRLGLERRVDESVTAAARTVMEATGTAGEHLSKAWTEAYGRSPNPSTAYGEAVKAVEAAAQPIVSPTDNKATLGKMIPALRDKPEKWDVVLAARPEFDQVQVIRLMAELLWQGHTDRHGAANPRPVTQDQAEAAVHLAVVLVQWFTAGSIHSRS